MLAIRRIGSKNQKSLWLFKCDCGNFFETNSDSFISGKTKSCGCLRKETTKLQGYKNRKYTYSDKRIKRIYDAMISRCYNQKNICKKNYSEKGILVCDEWKNDFKSFLKWSKLNGYEDNLTIDRIDNFKNYEPSNCRWATYKDQQNNRTNNRIVNYKGQNLTVSQLSDKLNIPYATLLNRLNRNWNENELSMKPNLNNKNIRRNLNE